MNKTLVVVPTFNERENLPLLTQRILALPVPVDIQVVDDNSPDGTGKLGTRRVLMINVVASAVMRPRVRHAK